MRIAFAVNGTRGDIQPAVVLAHALAVRGHHIRLGVPPNLVRFAQGIGVEVTPLGVDSRELMAEVGRVRERAGGSPWRRIQAAASVRDRGWAELVSGMAALTEDADLIVAGFITEQPALAHAQAAGVPLVCLHHAPIRRNAVVGPLPAIASGPRMTLLQWALADVAVWALTAGRENRLRAGLGMGRVRRRFDRRMRAMPGVELQLYDRLFALEGDRVWRADSVLRTRPVVGFVDLPPGLRAATSGESAAPELTEWLAAGPAPVYIGFGSMPINDGATVRSMVRVAAGLGLRILLCTGWNDRQRATGESTWETELGAGDELGTDVLRIVSAIDHEAVFPRCAVIIHHGGAGTTAAALRAARPSVICWYGSDQPWWGRQLSERGGATMLSYKRFTNTDFERALRGALAPEMAVQTRRLSSALTDPDRSIEHAVEVIESLLPCAGETVERSAS